jgi:nitrogen fixation NifU-like protein
MAYSKKVLQHFNKSPHIGSMDPTALDTGMAVVGAPACGDVGQLSIRVRNGIIQDAKFKAYGCPAMMASNSYLCEQIKGKTIAEAQTIKNTQIAQDLALPPIKFHCSIMAEELLIEALNDYLNKKQTRFSAQ